MTTDSLTDSKSISAQARKAHALGVMPDTALKVVRLAGDPDSSTADLEVVFRSDPVMAARLLKVANSAYYGLRGDVATIQHAITLLGANAIRNIALASSVGPLARGISQAGDFSPKSLMRHLLYTAAAAAEIAKELDGVDPDEAFLAGILHDIGLILEAQVDLDSFLDALDDWQRNGQIENREFVETENAHFEISHAELAAQVCELWGLPKGVQAAIRLHHALAGSDSDMPILARVVCVADQLDHGRGDHGVKGHGREPMDDAVFAETLGLEPARIPRIKKRIEEAASEVISMFY